MKKLALIISFTLLVMPALAFGECIEGDCANGFGVYIFPEGGEYSGEFAGGEFSVGKQLFADGNRYEGTFHKSTPHGNGVLTYADGSVYQGNFDMGIINGRGAITFKNKSKYDGEFVNGQFEGKGTYTYSNGNRYVGEFKKGMMHGKGTLYSDGRVYRGQFKNGEHHGKGTITYFDKSQETGEWKNGKFVVLQRTKAPLASQPEKSENDFFGDKGFEEDQDAWQSDMENSQDQEDMFFQDRFAEENNSPSR